MAPKALANSSASVPSSVGHRIGSADIAPVLAAGGAERSRAASRHSLFSPSSAGVMIRIISGIWKNR